MRKLGIFFSILIVALPLFAASCVTTEVPVVETYYETEYRTEYKTEPYTETVDAVVESQQGRTYLDPVVKWYTNVLISGFEGAGGTHYYGYWIDPSGHSKAQVEISISPGGQQQEGLVRVYDLTGVGQISPRPTPFNSRRYELDEISWLNHLNYTLNTARILGELRTGVGMDDYIVFDANGVREFGIFATTWNAYTIGSVKLVWVDEEIGKKTVTLEKQVPYQVPYQVEKQRTVTKTEKVPFWQAILGR
jgi:hypothetical protein